MKYNKEVLTEEEKKKRQQLATKRFVDKMYKKCMIRLRHDIDKVLIDYIEEKKEEGVGITELVREGLWKLYNEK